MAKKASSKLREVQKPALMPSNAFVGQIAAHTPLGKMENPVKQNAKIGKNK